MKVRGKIRFFGARRADLDGDAALNGWLDKRPSKKALRQNRAERGKRLFAADVLRSRSMPRPSRNKQCCCLASTPA
jgi:hypothetical protein